MVHILKLVFSFCVMAWVNVVAHAHRLRCLLLYDAPPPPFCASPTCGRFFSSYINRGSFRPPVLLSVLMFIPPALSPSSLRATWVVTKSDSQNLPSFLFYLLSAPVPFFFFFFFEPIHLDSARSSVRLNGLLCHQGGPGFQELVKTSRWRAGSLALNVSLGVRLQEEDL